MNCMTVLIWLEHILATGGDFVIYPTEADSVASRDQFSAPSSRRSGRPPFPAAFAQRRRYGRSGRMGHPKKIKP
jgi:hypothetical protein